MVPIYEQGGGQGIGHSKDSFLERFNEIISQHQEEGRAKKFCLMLYDFTNRDLRIVIKDTGFFAAMDRLTGNEMSLFYMHSSATCRSLENYNKAISELIQDHANINLPCLVFFEWEGQRFTNISVVYLESPDLMHGIREIEGAVSKYLQNGNDGNNEKSVLKWVTSSGRFVSLETIRGAIRELVSLAF